MLLFNPSLGQIADRFHILMLKISAACEKGADFSALEKEYRACRNAMTQFMMRADVDVKMLLKFTDLSVLLYEQNELQWRSEDKIHLAIKSLPANPSYEDLLAVVDLAKTTHLGNERRASLVAEIDELFGETAERKTYR